MAGSYRPLKLAKRKIENYSKALDAEMEKGKKIQRDFLPDQISLHGVSVSDACESESDLICDNHHPALRAVSLTNDHIAGAKLAQIEPGGTLIGYTDGVTEALSSDRELYTR